jgi:GTP cyclohydrolase II
MTPTLSGPASLPLRWGDTVARFTLMHFDFDGDRWIAAYVGALDGPEPVPLRIESACVFGHILRSQQCDCGYQLDMAMRQFAHDGRGLLVYGLDQDARGLGTAAHFAIYQMRQQEHLDTAEVFQRLGAELDNRSYTPVLAVLSHLRVTSVRLLSNNEGRLRFLRDNGVAATMEPLESPLDVNNMSTLMLEKEDLGYSWSFETHADWLEPMQGAVRDTPDESMGCIVVVGHGVADPGEAVVRGDIFDLAEALAGHVPAVRRSGPLVAYLTDLPPVGDIVRYRDYGVQVVVVPFNPVPAELLAAGAAADIRVVDWARRNAYAAPRPQWRLHHRGSGFDVYRRGERVRVLASGEAPADQISRLWSEAVARGAAADEPPKGRWFEVSAAHWPDHDGHADASGRAIPAGAPR